MRIKIGLMEKADFEAIEALDDRTLVKLEGGYWDNHKTINFSNVEKLSRSKSINQKPTI